MNTTIVMNENEIKACIIRALKQNNLVCKEEDILFEHRDNPNYYKADDEPEKILEARIKVKLRIED